MLLYNSSITHHPVIERDRERKRKRTIIRALESSFFSPLPPTRLNLSRDINRERDNVVAVASCMTNETDIARLHEAAS